MAIDPQANAFSRWFMVPFGLLFEKSTTNAAVSA
jgi:hypothetical protein